MHGTMNDCENATKIWRALVSLPPLAAQAAPKTKSWRGEGVTDINSEDGIDYVDVGHILQRKHGI